MKLENYLNYAAKEFYDKDYCPVCLDLSDTMITIYEYGVYCDNCGYELFSGLCSSLSSEHFLTPIHYDNIPVYNGVIAINNSHEIKERKDLVTKNLKMLYESIENTKSKFELALSEKQKLNNPSRDIGGFFSVAGLIIPISIWDHNNELTKGLLKETLEECMLNIDEITDEIFKYHRFKINKDLSEDEENELLNKYQNPNVIKEMSWIKIIK